MKRIVKKCLKALWVIPTWIICRFLPLDSKKIVASSYYGRGYGDNPKYIVDQLLKSPQKLHIIWLVKDEKELASLPNGVEGCRMNTIACIYHLSTSKIWIDNCRKGVILFKRRNQVYLQTWHGFALKRIEKDVADKLSVGYVKSAVRDAKHTDYIISCSSFMTNIYRTAFWYDGKILEFGAPRNDMFISENVDIKEKVYKYFGMDINKKIVMYAPTFRVDGNMDVYSIDYIRLKNACEKRFGGDFVVLTRLHPNIASQSKDIHFDNKNIINGSYYPDMQELMVASNIIITDYSSVMFDFALSHKPCFQFAVDIDEYKNDRNFYFEIDKLPFALAVDNDQLEENILDFDEDKYIDALECFYSSVGIIRNGKASQKCAELIIHECLKNNMDVILEES